MESGILDIFKEQSHLPALDNLLFSRNLCERVNFYLVNPLYLGILITVAQGSMKHAF